MTHRALTSAWPSPPLPHIVKLLTPLPARTVIVDLGCGDAGLARSLVPQGKIVLSYDLVGDSGIPSEGTSGGWVVATDFLEGVPLPGRPGGMGAVTDKEEESGGDKKKKSKKGKSGDVDASEIVDAVVCCLSLMGTNWIGGIYEACRILKQGSVCLVLSRLCRADN
jgi:ribosomal RNA-processing protein 8